MISHKVKAIVVELGSMIAYYVWESPHVEIPITQNFYWHDKNCTKSVGPFSTLHETMTDYALTQRAQRALQNRGLVQELQRMRGPFAFENKIMQIIGMPKKRERI